jgi:hypothetical protein
VSSSVAATGASVIVPATLRRIVARFEQVAGTTVRLDRAPGIDQVFRRAAG